MKTKISLIPFIPFTIAIIALKVMGIIGLDENGKFMDLNAIGVSYAAIGLTVALFLVCVLINIFDRKTAPVYPVKKNPVSGLFSILSGVAVIFASVLTFLTTVSDSENYIMTLVCAVFSVPAGIALALMSKVHFSGKATISSLSMVYVFPALWGCSELVNEFLTATKSSISASDLTSLFCYIFITLYLFSHSMVVSRIKGRNPVKACFIYGIPMIALSSAFGIQKLLTASKEGMDIVSIAVAAQFILLSLYAFSFIIEMFANSYNKDEVEIIDAISEDDYGYYSSDYDDTKAQDNVMFSPVNRDEAEAIPQTDDELAFSDLNNNDAIEVERPANATDEDEIVFSNTNPSVTEKKKRFSFGKKAETESKPTVAGDNDDLILSDTDNSGSTETVREKSNAYNDFIIGYVDKDNDDEVVPYLTKNEMKEVAASHIIFPVDKNTNQKTVSAKKEVNSSKSAQTKSEPVVKDRAATEVKSETAVSQAKAEEKVSKSAAPGANASGPRPGKRPANSVQQRKTGQRPAQRPNQRSVQRPVRRPVAVDAENNNTASNAYNADGTAQRQPRPQRPANGQRRPVSNSAQRTRTATKPVQETTENKSEASGADFNSMERNNTPRRSQLKRRSIAAEEKAKAERNMSDIDLLLQELENKK